MRQSSAGNNDLVLITALHHPDQIDANTPSWIDLTAPATIEAECLINAPLHSVFRSWADFESFPTFMPEVRSVTNLGVDRWSWMNDTGGSPTERTFVVTDLLLDRRVAWRAENGGPYEFAVTLQRVTDTTTSTILRVDFDPEFIDAPGDKFAFMQRRVEDDLDRFRLRCETMFLSGPPRETTRNTRC